MQQKLHCKYFHLNMKDITFILNKYIACNEIAVYSLQIFIVKSPCNRYSFHLPYN